MFSSYSDNHHFRIDERQEQRHLFLFRDAFEIFTAYSEEASEEDGNGRYGERNSTILLDGEVCNSVSARVRQDVSE